MKKEYSIEEINEIIRLYKSGMSFTKIGVILKRQKNNVKKILIDNNILIEDRDKIGIKFTDEEIIDIKKLYVENKKSCTKIAEKYNVSRNVITKTLKNNNINIPFKSNGRKINISDEILENIEKLYLYENKNSIDIGKLLNIKKSYIDKILNNSNYRRSKSEATKISKTGYKMSDEAKKNMSLAQQKLILEGKRKQSGGYCKYYNLNGIICQGSYEKKYIEILLENGCDLPNNSKPIKTPFGYYYPDFEFDDKFIEVKCDYTYDILIGIKPNRFTKKIDLTQLYKIEWVNKNIKIVDIIVVDKKNNILIKK